MTQPDPTDTARHLPADWPPAVCDAFWTAVNAPTYGESAAATLAFAQMLAPPPVILSDLRDRIAEALYTTRRTDYEGAANHREHRYDARCALCAGDVDALTAALLVVLPDPAAELLQAQAEAHQYRTALQGAARRTAAQPDPAANRAAILTEAADGFDRHAEQMLDGVGNKAVFVAKALMDQAAVWREGAETLRRMAAEAQPTTKPEASAAIRRKLRQWAYAAGHIESELDGAVDRMYALIAQDVAAGAQTASWL
ncbi:MULTISPECIES: hypothetical protein [unclassified Streptomyces]|uniref:hypothetical protein n=1 Tax=unclassified Streptomyces TaxID=2593676 RepID=UPI00224E74A5|nr:MULTISPECIES: hypothetical protein [unclassified Streptomyces]MCX4405918.1 hypothetical protein [Streptomyces sp. NBC_01764]MCX5189558.1 hypothetical protein [Streptomyces sp. NBC_00268]